VVVLCLLFFETMFDRCDSSASSGCFPLSGGLVGGNFIYEHWKPFTPPVRSLIDKVLSV